MRKQKILFIVVLLLIGAGLIAAYESRKPGVVQQLAQPAPSTIDSYEKCAAAGNPILESYPEQCVTKDGKHFTRQLTEKEQRDLRNSFPENQ